jgi:hypothetical protein
MFQKYGIGIDSVWLLVLTAVLVATVVITIVFFWNQGNDIKTLEKHDDLGIVFCPDQGNKCDSVGSFVKINSDDDCYMCLETATLTSRIGTMINTQNMANILYANIMNVATHLPDSYGIYWGGLYQYFVTGYLIFNLPLPGQPCFGRGQFPGFSDIVVPTFANTLTVSPGPGKILCFGDVTGVPFGTTYTEGSAVTSCNYVAYPPCEIYFQFETSTNWTVNSRITCRFESISITGSFNT